MRLLFSFLFLAFTFAPSINANPILERFCCNRISIPVNPDKFSAEGLKKTIEELERVSQEYRHTINYNLLYTLYDGREAISQKYLIEYRTKYKDLLIPAIINRYADAKNALDQKKSIFDFPKAPAREDFDLLARGIMGFSSKEGNS